MIIQVRGLNFRYHCDYANMTFAAISDFGKITLTSDSQGYFVADAETTKGWAIGKYTYQILSPEKILEQGEMIIKENFALEDATPYSSYWRKVLKAVEDRIAGKSLDSATDITVR